MATSGSRLAQVANERRRQRRMEASKTKHQDETTGGKGKASQQIQIGLACAPTASATFDDSTISTGIWTQKSDGQSTITEGTFHETETFTPPLTILSPSRKFNPNSNKNKGFNKTKTPPKTVNAPTNNKPVASVTTPRRRNIHSSYQAKLRTGGSLLSSSSTAVTAASSSCSSLMKAATTHKNNNLSAKASTPAPAATPKNNNLSANKKFSKTTPRGRRRNNLTSPSVASASTKGSNDRYTIKYNNTDISSIATSIASENEDETCSFAASMATAETHEQIQLLTTERDKLRADLTSFKKKLQNTIDSKNTCTKERDDIISDLEGRLEELTSELELSESQVRNTIDSKDSCTKERDDIISELEDRLEELTAELELSESQVQNTIDSKNSCTKESDDIISELEDRLEELSMELEVSESQVRNATLSAGDATHHMTNLESKVADLTKKLELSKAQAKRAEMELREHGASVTDVVRQKANLESKLDDLSKELKLSKSQTRSAEMKIKECEQNQKKELDLARSQLRRAELEANESEQTHTHYASRLNALQEKLNETAEEMALLLEANEELNEDKLNAEERLEAKEKELNEELAETRDNMNRMEECWKSCLERLEDKEIEYKQKYELQAQSEARLEQSLLEMQNERRSAISESRRELSSVQLKLSNATNDKIDLEKSYQDQISDLQNELQMQRISSENVKCHHAKIVEGLKSDLAKTRQLREESSMSLQQDMETMKSEYDDSMTYYKDEVENLRSQLRTTKSRADADRKEWTNSIQPSFERKFESLQTEKENLTQQLQQAQKDIECLKSVRNKDIELLESELDKTYKAKVEIEMEFKDTKRQLHNALRNLNEMTMDGGKMRTDLEGVMHDFTKEKQHYQNEINQLQTCNVEQQGMIDNLSRETAMYEETCNELSHTNQTLEEQLKKEMNNVQNLEDRMVKEMRAKQHHDGKLDNLSKESATYEHNCKELRATVQNLEERLKKETSNAQTLEERLMNEMRMNKKHAEDAGSKEVLQLEIQYMKNKLEKSQEEIASASATASSREARLASDAQSELSELKAKITTLESEKLQMQTKMASHTESMESTRNGQREMHAELSRAQQMIKMLRSKERYLESRVESLANQISKTVQDYEMRLTTSNSIDSSCGGSVGGGSTSGNIEDMHKRAKMGKGSGRKSGISTSRFGSGKN